MRGLFNAVCSRCGILKPRCAKIWFKTGPNAEFPRTYCDDCRKATDDSSFTYDPQHKPVKRVKS